MARASDSRLREPGFRAKPWASFFTLHRSSLLSCMNEYLAIDRGGYLCTNKLQYGWMLPK